MYVQRDETKSDPCELSLASKAEKRGSIKMKFGEYHIY